uniref:Elongation of very long chain fatty acids protein n=1 Tax=Ascaris lumbricoides TaxID=6252 RepID=A0A0M3IMM9_ASCLU
MGLIQDALSSINRQIKQMNDFELYRNNSTHSLHNNYVYKYALPFEKVGDPVSATLLLQRKWHYSITISIVYFMVIKIIQRLMRDREPFRLQKQLFTWNASLAVFSLIGFLRFTEVSSELIYAANYD